MLGRPSFVFAACSALLASGCAASSGMSAPPQAEAATRIARDVTWLAAPAREGRGAGTKGLEAAGDYLAAELQRLGIEPAGDHGGYRQTFPLRLGVSVAAGWERGTPRTSLRPSASVVALR